MHACLGKRAIVLPAIQHTDRPRVRVCRFIGNNMFCFKWCNDNGTNPAGKCQHTLDRIGLLYNCPSKYTAGAGYQAGEFEICDSDLMTVPGIYVDASGATQSYEQPPEALGEITTSDGGKYVPVFCTLPAGCSKTTALSQHDCSRKYLRSWQEVRRTNR